MYKFWYDYVKVKCREKENLCYTGSFIVYIKTEDVYVDIAKDVETRSDTSSHKLERLLPKGKDKTAI